MGPGVLKLIDNSLYYIQKRFHTVLLKCDNSFASDEIKNVKFLKHP